jgi:hypothetical protein
LLTTAYPTSNAVFQAAHAGAKTFEYVYDYSTPRWIDEIAIEGESSGYWCEGSELGGSYCHNDNGFSVAFSTDGTTWSEYNPGAISSYSCGYLNNGCGWKISPRQIRYMKLRVHSSCSGCSNNDNVHSIKVQRAVASYEDLQVVKTSRGYISPQSLVSASCSSGCDAGGSALGSTECHGGEPAQTCLADETDNAMQLLQGGESNFRAASGSRKTYLFVYDFGSDQYIDSFDLEGRSTGYWCEDSLLGGSYCHNDNGFSVAFSTDGTTWSDFNEGFSTSDSCDKLDDGCGWTFAARKVRYVKLQASSGCSGCVNNDFVTTIKAHLAYSNAQLVDKINELTTASASWRSPSSVVSASCTSTLAPSYDPGAVGGEPAGTCEADEMTNAGNLLTGGDTVFRAASGSGKEYLFAYDFGSDVYLNELQLEGRSTGYWCEDGDLGGSYCHNDNGFSAAFSTDGTTWSDFNEGFSTTDSCGKLDDGCGWTFAPVKVRYVKIRAASSCSGCVNEDFVTAIKGKLAFDLTSIVDRLLALESNSGLLNVVQSDNECQVSCSGIPTAQLVFKVD